MMILKGLNKKEKIAFIEAHLSTMKDKLIEDVENMPADWTSWHLRLFIRDNVNWYSLSPEDQDVYENDVKRLFKLLKN